MDELIDVPVLGGLVDVVPRVLRNDTVVAEHRKHLFVGVPNILDPLEHRPQWPCRPACWNIAQPRHARVDVLGVSLAHPSTSRSRSRILATCFSRSASISARGRGGT